LEVKKGKLHRDEEVIKYYAAPDEQQLIMHFKDDISAFMKQKVKSVKNKGKNNGAISVALFKYLESYHIPTHFIQVLNPSDLLVKKLEMFSLEVVVWNLATGSLQKRFGLEKGRPLNYPILEFYLKNDKLKNPLITIDHACALGYAMPEEMQTIDKISRKANAVLKSFFERRDYKLMDFTLAFGKVDEQIMIGSALSTDTFHLSDLSDEDKLLNDPFSAEGVKLDEVYATVAQRLCS